MEKHPMTNCQTCPKEISIKTISGLCKNCYAKNRRLQNPTRQKEISLLAYKRRVANKIKKHVEPIQIEQLYNHWKVLRKASGRGEWTCLCTGCGVTQRDIKSYRLRLNRTKCCGCLKLHELTIKNIYGVENISQVESIKQKKRETLQSNFGEQGLRHPKILRKKEQTCVDNYGTTNPRQNLLIKEKGKQTCLLKYGTTHPNKRPSYRITKGIVLTNQEPLQTICEKYEVPKSSGVKIYNEYGEYAFLKWCEAYKSKRVYSTEACLIALLQDTFPNLTTFDKQPIEFKLNRRPDFRIELNNKVLYINTDGLYDHMNDGRRNLDKGYHLELAQSFKVNNQTIFQFRSDELRSKPNIIKSIILNYFGLHTSKYSARSCFIRPIATKDANLFFLEHHLMGHYNSTKTYGLYTKDNELVSCLSIRSHKKDNSIEIARFASKLNSSVRGGFSKLLNYITKLHNPSKIISFCDLRYSTGESYKRLGFELKDISLSWRWTDCHLTYNRLQCRANMDARKLSEAKYAEELKWHKIYDAGQAKYIKELK